MRGVKGEMCRSARSIRSSCYSRSIPEIYMREKGIEVPPLNANLRKWTLFFFSSKTDILDRDINILISILRLECKCHSRWCHRVIVVVWTFITTRTADVRTKFLILQSNRGPRTSGRKLYVLFCTKLFPRPRWFNRFVCILAIQCILFLFINFTCQRVHKHTQSVHHNCISIYRLIDVFYFGHRRCGSPHIPAVSSLATLVTNRFTFFL